MYRRKAKAEARDSTWNSAPHRSNTDELGQGEKTQNTMCPMERVKKPIPESETIV